MTHEEDTGAQHEPCHHPDQARRLTWVEGAFDLYRNVKFYTSSVECEVDVGWLGRVLAGQIPPEQGTQLQRPIVVFINIPSQESGDDVITVTNDDDDDEGDDDDFTLE